ncbi:MAG TPA: hypothetical protein VFS08_02805 [Gemmatimonadaceae bacterium]|nr:hypothetical protein [Gemmatimonadaceae bacterium]
MTEHGWIAGWPPASWFGLVGALAARGAALLDRATAGEVPWMTVAAGCLALALVVRRKAEGR